MRTILISLAIIAANSVAAEPGGESRMTLNGVEYLAALDPDQSDWSDFSNNRGSVSLYLRTTQRDLLKDFAGFSLGFEFNGTSAQNPELDVRRLPDSGLVRLYSEGEEDKGGLVVAIENLSSDGKELTISGTINGTLGASEDFGRTMDFSDPVTMSATFDVTVAALR